MIVGLATVAPPEMASWMQPLMSFTVACSLKSAVTTIFESNLFLTTDLEKLEDIFVGSCCWGAYGDIRYTVAVVTM